MVEGRRRVLARWRSTDCAKKMIREKGDGLIIRIWRRMIGSTRQGIRSGKNSRSTWNVLELKIIFGEEKMPSGLTVGEILCSAKKVKF